MGNVSSLADNKGSITSSTQLYAVIGDPIHHSKSPLMQNAALQACGIDAVYTAFHVKPEQLEACVAGMRALGIRGMNVTIPHKEHVMKMVDEVDSSAAVIGAVNTIVNDQGKLIGYNTDGLGFVRSLKEETGVDLQVSRILMIGAGGAARGLCYALLKEGCKQLTVANRTVERALSIADELRDDGSIQVARIENGWPEMNPEDVDIVINTTSVGMHPHVDDSSVAKDWMKSHMIVSDIIYNPLKTKLLQDAEAVGAVTHSGLGMFVYQGAIAFELWTGIEAPVKVMREAVLQAL
ncbi:shikimate dehydrogenase [Paenibacillus sp. 1001270B_150601_E10]|uniref:shikimate dehydrogenase n=1 Tax=Paenibacillus sp. 1001270B_150601_E10 TaxID=2787079 RepID=UPI00189FA74F|nr:shikimate dehydrogenase [Paenibacillus sp. 1001270B_150601_E10]